MRTALAVFTVTVFPILLVVLLSLAEWLHGRRQEAIRRQTALTDAIHREFGPIVAPVVKKPVWGPWQIRIAVPFTRPATVGTIFSIAHRVLSFAERMNPGRYQIVLAAQEEPTVAVTAARPKADEIAGASALAGVVAYHRHVPNDQFDRNRESLIHGL